MARISLVTVFSVLLNMFLTFWLINQYLSDVYFQNYVNAAIGQYYAFIVLTIGVGGGSGLGYLFLRKKHSDHGLIGKIQKSKSFKPLSPMPSTTASASAQKSILPAGAPPSPTSKHTVYAVPPLPKSSTPSSSRTTPATTWSGSSRQSLETFPASKQDTPARPAITGMQTTRGELARPSSSAFSPTTQSQSPQPLHSISETTTKPSPPWTPQPSQFGEKRPESGPMFQKPGMDASARQDASFSSSQASARVGETSPVPPKWAPPAEPKLAGGQWSEPGVRSIPPLPTKWTPPSGSGGSQERPLPPQGMPQGFPRPGQPPVRGPMPPPQGGPRPFAPPQGRPGEPRPIAAPRPLRPEPMRPPLPMGNQGRPPQPMPRPAAPLSGPMPQPWTPPSESSERKEPPSLGDPQGTVGRSSQESKGGAETPSGGGGGEMDWDTALDTILKTLRKDRVGDTK